MRRLRAVASLLALALVCTGASSAWCANLWFATEDADAVDSFTAKQLATSGTPVPLQLKGPAPTGLAFDSSHNLWVVAGQFTVEKFTRSQLKKLKKVDHPTPALTITSSMFEFLVGCAFDKHGNLWLVDTDTEELYELSKSQLKSGGTVTPAIVVTSGDFDTPEFVTFDKSGDAWIDNNTKIIEFTASQLTSGGAQTPDVIITDGAEPGELAFDKKGNLWVPEFGDDTVVEYTRTQLASSGSPTPAVTLSSVSDSIDGPESAAFEGSDLIVYNQKGGTVSRFSATQLKSSGSPTPAAFLHTVGGGFKIIVGPSS